MPKRILDFDALWASDKLASCQEQNRVEYAWLYGLADANGSFEITNLRVILGKVSPIRPSLTLERIEEIFRDFSEHGLLFVWEEKSKKFAHWTGSNKAGRLPNAAHRARYASLAPEVPKNQLLAYTGSELRISSGESPDRIGIGFGLVLEGNRIGARAPREVSDNVSYLERLLRENPSLSGKEKVRIQTEIQRLRGL